MTIRKNLKKRLSGALEIYPTSSFRLLSSRRKKNPGEYILIQIPTCPRGFTDDIQNHTFNCNDWKLNRLSFIPISNTS